MNMVTKNDHNTAMAADSVAVKIPERMPPRMITIAIMPQRASPTIFSAWRIGITSPLG